MFGGGGGMDPQKMQQMMEQMGVDMDELDADEVVIRLADGEELVFHDPEVTRMDARGQQTYSVVGEPDERRSSEHGGEGEPQIPSADVEIVADRTGASESEARDALEATEGDLAAAIDLLE